MVVKIDDMAKEKSTVKTKAKLVSFKLPEDKYKQLEAYAETARDNVGFRLSPSMAARMLMLDALKHRNRDRKKP